MSDKTVPTDANDYKENDRTPATKDRRIQDDPLVRRARNEKGETPNRDSDEFSKDHLKKPEVDIETEEKINETSDER